MRICDNTSVGVVIEKDGQYLMFDRATFPSGAAAVAGHGDGHGGSAAAARAEVAEELGLTVVTLEEVTGGWRSNRCRRLLGPRGVGHQWVVYRATVAGVLAPSVRETRHVRWLPAGQLQHLAERTAAYAHGELPEEQLAARPGLEPVWARWFTDLAAIRLSPADLAAIDRLATAGA